MKLLQSLLPISREKLVALLVIVFPLLILYNAFFRPWLIHPERALFYGFIIALTFLIYPLKSKGAVRRKIYFVIDLLLITGTIASALFIMFDWEYIVRHAGATPRPIDMTLGIVATLATLEAVRRTMFPLLPLCIAFLLYAMYGVYLSGPMAAAPLSIERLIQALYLSTTGLFGIVFDVGLKYVVPFLIMGSLLKAMGAMDVLGDLVNKLVGRTAGGPAKIAVCTSAAFGSISGAAIANVVFTGTFTIPLMKKYGFKKEFAGGVEAAASCGGQFMPPIMGAGAFIMADYTGIPYRNIILAALVPALLYYAAIFIRVHFKAKQLGLEKPSGELIGRIYSYRELIPRFIPLAIVFAVLMFGLITWTPTRAAAITIAAIIPISFLRRESRLTPRKLIDGLSSSTYSFSSLGAAFLAMGILVAVALVSGLGLKFSELITTASGQNLFVLLLLTAVALLIMGMGIGGTVVYVFGAVMIAPALMKLGIPVLSAHLFIFYFAIIQSVTPPVCLTSYTAASIANANPFRTAFHAVALASMGFIVPFLFVEQPELLLQGSPVSIGIVLLLTVLGLIGLIVGIGGYLNRNITLLERALLIGSAFLALIPWDITFRLVGVVVIVGLIIASVIIKKRSKLLLEGVSD
jgi:TRAP transporter 4TM/12TM fusion protein